MSRVFVMLLVLFATASCQGILDIEQGMPRPDPGAGGSVGMGGSGGSAAGGAGGAGGGSALNFGAPELLVDLLDGPNDLAIDASRAYWLAPDGLGSVLKAGGSTESVVLASQSGGLATTGGALYWMEPDGNLHTTPGDDLMPIAFFSVLAGPLPGRGAITQGTYFGVDGFNNQVHAVPLDMGSLSSVNVTCEGEDLAADPNLRRIFMACSYGISTVTTSQEMTLVTPSFRSAEVGVVGVAMGDGELFFVTGAAGGRLGAVDVQNSEVRYLADIPFAIRVAVDAFNAYVLISRPTGGGVLAVRLSDNEPKSLVDVTPTHTNPRRIRVDDSGVYWVNEGSGNNSGSVWRIRKN